MVRLRNIKCVCVGTILVLGVAGCEFFEGEPGSDQKPLMRIESEEPEAPIANPEVESIESIAEDQELGSEDDDEVQPRTPDQPVVQEPVTYEIQQSFAQYLKVDQGRLTANAPPEVKFHVWQFIDGQHTGTNVSDGAIQPYILGTQIYGTAGPVVDGNWGDSLSFCGNLKRGGFRIYAIFMDGELSSGTIPPEVPAEAVDSLEQVNAWGCLVSPAGM